MKRNIEYRTAEVGARQGKHFDIRCSIFCGLKAGVLYLSGFGVWEGIVTKE
jgi:hypothetical protein